MDNCAPPAQPIRVRSTCDVCLDAKVRCSRDRPACRRCQHHGRECVYSNKRRLGRPRGTTSKARTDSQSSGLAGAWPGPLMNAAETSPSSASGNASNAPTSQDLSQDPTIPVDEQRHIHFSNEDQHDYSYFPTWLSSLDRNQHRNGVLLYDPSSLADPQMDYDQQGESSPTYVDVDTTGSASMDSSYSLTLVDSARTAGLTCHIGSPLDYAENISHPMSSTYLTPIDSNTWNSGRTPSEFPTDGSSVGDPIRTADMYLSPDCRCYGSILQRLSQLKDDKSGVPAPGWSYIMQLEVDIRIQILSVMRCEQCLYQRARALLLVGVILESVVDLLENIAMVESLMVAGERFVARPALDNRASSNSSSGSDTSRYTSVPSGSSHAVGQAICGEDRKVFLRPLIRARLQDVFGLTRQLHEHAYNVRGPTTSLGAADTVMTELGLRVCAVMGRLEG